jgi:hypothetical protein
MPRLLIYTALLLATTASAQNPTPRVGDDCPTSIYRSGHYCKPITSASGVGCNRLDPPGSALEMIS